MRSPPFATLARLTAPVLFTLLAACSDATGSVQGGDPLFDGGADSAGSTDTAPTFTALYGAFFGPTGKASCAGDGACHGASDQPGAQATGSEAFPTGFVCAPDRASCWQAMTGAGLVSIAAGTSVEQTRLFAILRKSGGGGSMPLRPKSVAFSPAEMAQVRAWIAAGAKND